MVGGIFRYWDHWSLYIHPRKLASNSVEHFQLQERPTEGAVATVGLGVRNTAGIGGRDHGAGKRAAAVLDEVRARCAAVIAVAMEDRFESCDKGGIKPHRRSQARGATEINTRSNLYQKCPQIDIVSMQMIQSSIYTVFWSIENF